MEVSTVVTAAPSPAAAPTPASSLHPMPEGTSAVKQTLSWQKEGPEGCSIVFVKGNPKLVKTGDQLAAATPGRG